MRNGKIRGKVAANDTFYCMFWEIIFDTVSLQDMKIDPVQGKATLHFAGYIGERAVMLGKASALITIHNDDYCL